MAEVREVCIGDSCYYYLFGYKKGKSFKKYAKFLGKDKPNDEYKKQLENQFEEEIIKKQVEVEEHKINFIGILQELQEKEGYISRDQIIKISKELDIPAVELYGVATFYSQFKLSKTGKHRISLCRGTACHVKKSAELLHYLEEVLGMKAGETDKAGKITLEVVNCIGACAKAPAMMINNKVYGELTREKIKQFLEELK